MSLAPGRYGCSHQGSLQWRHDERDGVSNHQPHDCLLNRLFRRRSKKTLNLRVTGRCEGNSPVTGEFPAQRASNAESVSIWWRHHIAILSISCKIALKWNITVDQSTSVPEGAKPSPEPMLTKFYDTVWRMAWLSQNELNKRRTMTSCVPRDMYPCHRLVIPHSKCLKKYKHDKKYSQLSLVTYICIIGLVYQKFKLWLVGFVMVEYNVTLSNNLKSFSKIFNTRRYQE